MEYNKAKQKCVTYLMNGLINTVFYLFYPYFAKL